METKKRWDLSKVTWHRRGRVELRPWHDSPTTQPCLQVNFNTAQSRKGSHRDSKRDPMISASRQDWNVCAGPGDPYQPTQRLPDGSKRHLSLRGLTCIHGKLLRRVSEYGPAPAVNSYPTTIWDASEVAPLSSWVLGERNQPGSSRHCHVPGPHAHLGHL